MKNVILVAAVVLVSCTGTLIAQGVEGRGGGGIDDARIRRIADKLGITTEEVKERIKNRNVQGGRPGNDAHRPQWAQGRGNKSPQRPGSGTNASVAVATTDKYLFVVKGNNVYQFDVNTLKLLNTASLKPEKKDRRKDFRNRIEERVEKVKQKIEHLKKEGKTEEAEKLEKHLKQWLNKMKNREGADRDRGWKKDRGNRKKDKGGNKPEKEKNEENEVLF